MAGWLGRFYITGWLAQHAARGSSAVPSFLLRASTVGPSPAGNPGPAAFDQFYFTVSAPWDLWSARGFAAEEESLFSESRRDYSALLFNRSTPVTPPPTQSTPWTLWTVRAPSVEDEPYTPSAPTSLIPFQHVATAKPYLFWSIAYRPAKFVDTTEDLYTQERAGNADSSLLYWLNNQSTPQPPPIVIPPPPAQGSPSGFVRGPVKRPDQIFGEQDPVSPWLGDDSRSTGYSPMAAERAAANLRAPEMAMPSDEQREAVIALMRELL